MTRSHRHREQSGSNNRMSQDDLLEGTSARTRPLSFDDIMLRRKNKAETAKQVNNAPENVEKAFDYPELHREVEEGSEPMEIRHTRNESKKISSRRKEDTGASRKNDKLVQDKEEGSIDPDAKSKDVGDKNVSSRTEGKNEKRDHSSKKTDGLVAVGSGNGSNKRHCRDSHKEDRVSERSRVKSEIARKEPHNEDRQVYRKRKPDGPMASDSQNEYKKRNAKDVTQTDKLTDRSREKSDKLTDKSREKSDKLTDKSREKSDKVTDRSREKSDKLTDRSREKSDKVTDRSREKYDKLTDRSREKSEKEMRHKRPIEEDKIRGKTIDSEKKREEPTRVHLEESRPKRRRSRSREHDKGRSRRSVSHSPKGHNKHASDKREHVELSSHHTKEKPGREHFDADKKRLYNNGSSSSHHRRNDGPLSGLGGYSPRKRKTDAAAKTPSPTHRSPEKRSAGWDLQPVEKKENNMAASSLSTVPITSQNLSLNIKEFPIGTPVTPPIMVNPIGVPPHTLSSQMHAIESIQLTQATRPMRRLYVENLPDSASEKDLIECINKFLLSSGINYIQGTQPCISCIIHKEKSQALLEFLTPEDASAALSLNGMSFSGSTLKLRRPKDYTNVTTALSDKSVVAVDSISDIVEDSPDKIFIGGISKLISSKMLLEIAKIFGHVKAFHFECMAEINETCAFLEYADHSVTSKACASLNGMRLGGQIVTAVFATQEASLEENVGEKPLYRIPKHAKPLLEKPTSVLKLKNVLDPEGLLSMSESELEEILEDIRLESSRFGTVKSINVSKPNTNTFSTMEADEIKTTSASTDVFDSGNLGESIIKWVEELDRLEPPKTPKELEDNSYGNTPMEDELCKPPSNDENTSVEDPPNQENSGGFTEENLDPQNASVIELESNEKVAASISDKENIPLTDEELKSEESNPNRAISEEVLKLEENNSKKVISLETGSVERKELDAPNEDNKQDFHIDLDYLFEPGSVFVEYRRPEAACMAAHHLNGRIFDGRVVTVGYVGQDLYLRRFRR